MLHTKKCSNKIYSSGLAIHSFAFLLKMPINNFFCTGFLQVYIIKKTRGNSAHRGFNNTLLCAEVLLYLFENIIVPVV